MKNYNPDVDWKIEGNLVYSLDSKRTKYGKSYYENGVEVWVRTNKDLPKVLQSEIAELLQKTLSKHFPVKENV